MKRLSDRKFAKIMHSARARNAAMTRIEHEGGFAAPQDSGFAGLLLTVKDALECGVKAQDWNAVCEGLALLHKALVAKGWWRVESWSEGAE
jgi:hypothetical protein